MANVIDAFLITLGLDVKEYKKGLKEVEDESKKAKQKLAEDNKKIEESTKKLTESYESAKRELAAFVTIAMGASSLKDLVVNTTKTQMSLYTLSQNLNMSAKDLDAWGAAAESVGGSAQGIQQTFSTIAQGITNLRLGRDAGEFGKAMNQLSAISMQKYGHGISLTDAKGNARAAGDVFKDIASVWGALSPQEQLVVGGMLGIDVGGQGLLRMGQAGMSARVEEMRKLSGVTDENTEAARRMTAEWAKFKQSMSGVASVIFTQVTPAIEDMLKLAEQLAELFKKADKATDGWSTKLILLASTLAGIVTSLKAITTIKNILTGGGAAAAAEKTGGGIMARLSPLLGRLGPIAAGVAMMFHSKGAGEGEDEIVKHLHDKPASKVTPPVPPASAPLSTQGFAALEKANGLPPGTLDKIWNIESARGKNMISPAGATGHFQFMPKTAKEFGLSREDTFDLGKSSAAAAKYLGQLLKMFHGNMQQAVSAYNWGPGNVMRKGLGMAPAETVNYWRKFSGAGGVGGGSNSSVETNIGTINIATQATDSAGIARGMKDALQQNSLIVGGAMGMN